MHAFNAITGTGTNQSEDACRFAFWGGRDLWKLAIEDLIRYATVAPRSRRRFDAASSLRPRRRREGPMRRPRSSRRQTFAHERSLAKLIICDAASVACRRSRM